MNEYVCVTCGGRFRGWGNNPDPIVDTTTRRCCDACNSRYVIPARLGQPVSGLLFRVDGTTSGSFWKNHPLVDPGGLDR